jgi:predicted transcriptional regulator
MNHKTLKLLIKNINLLINNKKIVIFVKNKIENNEIQYKRYINCHAGVSLGGVYRLANQSRRHVYFLWHQHWK